MELKKSKPNLGMSRPEKYNGNHNIIFQEIISYGISTYPITISTVTVSVIVLKISQKNSKA